MVKDIKINKMEYAFGTSDKATRKADNTKEVYYTNNIASREAPDCKKWSTATTILTDINLHKRLAPLLSTKWGG